jgi:hypothetical protein
MPTVATPGALPTVWIGFERGRWTATIDVRDFVQCNYMPYAGDAAFLAAHGLDAVSAPAENPQGASGVRAPGPHRVPDPEASGVGWNE